MTDNEIIKAFQYCFTNDFGKTNCYKCAFYTATAKCMDDMQNAVIDLINRQKAKIGKLKKKNTILSKNADTAFQDGLDENRDLFKKEVEPEIRAEAIKEFAERLKETITNAINTYYNSNGGGYYLAEDTIEYIDNLAKEMSEPSADVEEVRHGKWINDGDCFHCSVCNKSFSFLSEKCVSNFCPNCGAKMDKE